jgi:hypothetical protein
MREDCFAGVANMWSSALSPARLNPTLLSYPGRLGLDALAMSGGANLS